jgi:hypothetical protein
MRKILAVLTLGATMAISTGAAFAESAGGGASHDPVSATENATVIEVSGNDVAVAAGTEQPAPTFIPLTLITSDCWFTGDLFVIVDGS